MLRLGALLAEVLAWPPPHPALLLTGELGAGKTTLVRGLAESLPGGEEAEVSSPSFNLMNLYLTRPEVAHLDLYRLQGTPDDDLLDMLDDRGLIAAVEWSERLPERHWPGERIEAAIQAKGSGRRVVLEAQDPCGVAALGRLLPLLDAESMLDHSTQSV